MTHKCHHPDCDKRVPTSMFGCRPHWFSLPKPIRDEIWATWEARCNGQSFEATRNARAAHETAKSKAIEFWQAKAVKS